MAVWEWWLPCRKLHYSRRIRWFGNLGLLLVGVVLLRLIVPVAAVSIAAVAQANGWGVFNLIDIATVPAVVASVVLLDLAIYFQHVISHHVPLLWRIHRVHHADPDFDVTTALRFHPIEIVLSMLFKFVLVLALGPPLVAVVIFEILLNGTAMFNHGNVSLPKSIDRGLRCLLVTPDMHRVHHSIHGNETNRNFGFSIALWDRLFGTYQAQPQAGHLSMTIGLPLSLSHKGKYHTCVNLLRMLLLPFKRKLDSTVSADG